MDRIQTEHQPCNGAADSTIRENGCGQRTEKEHGTRKSIAADDYPGTKEKGKVPGKMREQNDKNWNLARWRASTGEDHRRLSPGGVMQTAHRNSTSAPGTEDIYRPANWAPPSKTPERRTLKRSHLGRAPRTTKRERKNNSE